MNIDFTSFSVLSINDAIKCYKKVIEEQEKDRNYYEYMTRQQIADLLIELK